MANNLISAKKKALLARKEKLLQEIQFYEKRIADFHADKRTSFFEDNDSSDSDPELPVYSGPSASQLRLQQAGLRTALQAQRELTDLLVVQSEVNVMVEDPVIIHEPQVRTPGVWREVIAECRLDLIPFIINFHVHTPSQKFGAPSYRNLKVSLVKSAHEVELAKSVLVHTTMPSEAVEVIRSYAVSWRSRRTSLSRLVDVYNTLLFMEPVPEGGYILKCAGLLEVSWTLNNSSSPLAPFQHRLKFDIEYMDESYVKTIKQYHRQLSNPSLETDERTAILCKIIDTCLEAKGPTQELYESMESDDPEAAQTLRKRRMTLDQEITETAPKKRDNDIMAPPKTLPKKSKAKGKENVDSAKKDDKASYVSGNSVKSADVLDKNVTRDSVKSKNGKKDGAESDGRKEGANKDMVDGRKESVAKSTKDNEGRKDVISTKETENGDARNNVIDKNVKENVAKGKSKADNRKDTVAKANKGTVSNDTKTSELNDKNNDNTRSTNIVETVHSKDSTNAEKDKNIEDGKIKSAKVIKKRVVPKDNANKEINSEKIQKVVQKNDKNDKESALKEKTNKNSDDNNSNDNKIKSISKKNKKTDDIANVPAKKPKIDNTTTKTQASNVKTIEKTKKPVNNVNRPQNIAKNLPKNDNAKTSEKTDAKNQKNIPKTNSMFTKNSETIQKVTEKNKIVSVKGNLADRVHNADKNANTDNIPKNFKTLTNNIQNKLKNVKSNIENNKNVNNERFSQKTKVITGNTKANSVKKLGAGNTAKETSTDSNISKIPQKMANSLKKNPLRISPRKMSWNTKSQTIGKTIQKAVTGIPRLLKKPVVK